MFIFPADSNHFTYRPRNSQSFHPNFFQPSHHSRPCSYYYNNNPFFNDQPHYPTPCDDYDEEQLLNEQLLRERLREEREQERLKKLYERNKREQQAQKSGASTKKSFRVKIQGSEEEEKTKAANKSRAAHKIYKFIKNQSANKKTRKTLSKLYSLHKIENELGEIRKTKNFGNLTFKEGNEKQILPISIENKQFLEYEDKVVKFFDKLDGIQSDGIDIIRERRKFIVKSVQALLDELDNEKESQWKAFNEKTDMVVDDGEKANETINNSNVIMSDAFEESEESSTTSDNFEIVSPITEEANVQLNSDVIMDDVEKADEIDTTNNITDEGNESESINDNNDTSFQLPQLEEKDDISGNMVVDEDKYETVSESPQSNDSKKENEFVFVEPRNI